MANPGDQQIWYTHSRTKAESIMQNTANNLLAENREKNRGLNSVSHPFVGTDDIMTKAATMDTIKNYDDLDGEGTVLVEATH